MIVARDLTYSYGEKIAVEGLNFRIGRGEFVAIVGPNGAGKSTLLKLMAGILKPTKGSIEVMGRRFDEIRDVVAYLPQRELINVDIPLKVSEVIRLAARARGVKLSKERLEKAIEMSGVDPNSLFRELSGGQQQRVLIARATVTNPEVLLLDEPFNGVDVANQQKIIESLRNLADEGKIVVVVVHNVNPVLHDVDRVMLLNRKLIAFGKPNEVFTERNILIAYGSPIPLVVCEEGVVHPLYGDYHG